MIMLRVRLANALAKHCVLYNNTKGIVVFILPSVLGTEFLIYKFISLLSTSVHDKRQVISSLTLYHTFDIGDKI